MSSSILQLLVLAGIAIFLILMLRNVLGTRGGFEKPPVQNAPKTQDPRGDFDVIVNDSDRDITDHVENDSDSAKALADMKSVEPGFEVSTFLQGARGAYEMILMAYENGDIEDIKSFLDADVLDTFETMIAQRNAQNLTIEASFIGFREVALQSATFDTETSEAEITVRFVAELTSVVKNAADHIVEGDPNEIKRQRDIWTFARRVGSNNPNWILVATDG